MKLKTTIIVSVISLMFAATATAFYLYMNRPIKKAGRHYNKAVIYQELKDYDNAIKEYNLMLPYADEPKSVHYVLGRLYVEKKEFRSAMTELDKAIAIDPKYKEAYFTKVDLLLQEKKYDEAKALIVKLEELFPDAVEPFLVNAQIFLLEGKLEDAKKEFVHVIYMKNDNPVARFFLAQICLKSNNLDGAKRNARAAIKFSKGNIPGAFLMLGDIFINERDYTKATKCLNRYLAIFPNDVQNQLKLGELYLANNEVTNAIEKGNQILKLDPKNVLARYLLGRAYFLNNEFTPAKENLRYALQSLPPNEVIYMQLGTTYDRLGQWKRALHYYQKALKLNPNVAEIRWAIATTALRNNKTDMAVRQSKAILLKEPKNIYALNMLAICYIQSKKYTEAIDIVDIITTIIPGFAYKDIYLAMARWGQGDVNACIDICNAALAKDPLNTTIRSLLGTIYLTINKTEAALAQFQEIKKSDYKNISALVNIARIYTITGNLKMAHKEYITLISYYPDLVSGRIGLGSLYLTILNYKAALEQFDLALNKEPQNLQAMVGKMQALIGLHEYVQAKSIGEEGLKTYPKDALLNGLTGDAYRNSGDTAHAEELFKKALEIDSKTVLGYELASVYVYKGNYAEALGLYKSALELNPEFLPILKKDAIVNQLTGNYEAALKDIALLKDKDTLIDYYLKFFIYISAGNYAEAEELTSLIGKESIGFDHHFAKYVELCRQDLKAAKELSTMLNKALYYQLCGWPEQCLKTLEEALKSYPDATITYHMIARTYSEVENHDMVIEYFQKLLKKDSEDPVVYQQLSKLFFKTDKKTSIEYFKKFSDLCPEATELHEMLASLYYQAGDLSNAMKIYEDAVNSNTASPVAYNNLAWFYQQEKKYDDALKLAEKATELSPQNANCWDTLGWIYLKMGKKDKAIDTISKATELSPEDAAIRYHLGLVYFYAGYLTEAQTQMQKVLSINPGYSKARHMLDKIANKMVKNIMGK